ncbi:hypothetical protein M0811_09674 [Anaeramoeba ignava]|uniref:U6 snRNA phosphodiesterase 1 n=1 Tax=Anaeramoeba ignava TaxID=1746090 RepID=A0A9Q0LHN2_ANAIG|nr:hypothetical protein M0811_09674 [Anaeramoeba ignava]
MDFLKQISSDSDSNSDSNSEKEIEINQKKKERKKRKKNLTNNDDNPKKPNLKLPQEFLEFLPENQKQKQKQNEKMIDSFGKVRKVPHIEGNFAFHIKITIQDKNNQFSKLIQTKTKEIEEKTKRKVFLIKDPHISLSETIYIRYHFIKPLIKKIQDSIIQSKVPIFHFSFDSIEWFENEEKTRGFIAFLIKEGNQNIIHLVNLINDCFLSFGFPIYLAKNKKEIQPHISFAWLPLNSVSKNDIEQIKIDIPKILIENFRIKTKKFEINYAKKSISIYLENN